MTLTNFPHDILAGGNCVYKGAAYSVTAATESGTTFYSDVDGMVWTLPAIGSGWSFTFVNTAEDGQAVMAISPNSVDGIMYATSATDDHDLANTKATHVQGDRVTISNVARTDYWAVTFASGIWAKL